MACSRTAYRFAQPDRDRRHRHGDRPPPRATRARPLSVRQELDGETATVFIAGDLDLTTTPALAEHLDQVLARRPRRLVLDLTEVTFVDVAAARVLTGSTRPLPAAGPPVLRRASPEARRILVLTGLDSLCEFDD
jgi:anti-sigma B factor antagonist